MSQKRQSTASREFATEVVRDRQVKCPECGAEFEVEAILRDNIEQELRQQLTVEIRDRLTADLQAKIEQELESKLHLSRELFDSRPPEFFLPESDSDS